MSKEKVLTIVRGEEFKINVNENIVEEDIFYDQYVRAAGILDAIVASCDTTKPGEWFKTESENNIIAFCGERGEGKSSAMMSFVKAAYALNFDKESIIFTDCGHVKRTYFAEPIVMDPSMFDDVHNVLDIVLATLYKKFRNKYDSDNQCLSVGKREELLDQFQKVYRCVSLINNQEKMLDDEYDYEGNISKLTKLGESTALRNELKKLIELYLEVILGPLKQDKSQRSLVLAIDDLDLCSSNAYKMAEQIRKYLIIPNVVIVMAIKVEQLQLCVKEENYRRFKKSICVRRQEICSEIDSMAERYTAKLLPRARRLYLPRVQEIHQAQILYIDRGGNTIFESNVRDSMNEVVLDYVFMRTGMRFLVNKSDANFLLPDNLRDVISMIVLLGDMEEPKGENSVYYDNIQKFCSYYEREWLPGNLNSEDSREVQRLIHSHYIELHEGAAFALSKVYGLTEKKFFAPVVDYAAETFYSFFTVINWLEAYHINVFGNAEEKYAYAYIILYTIRLNELLRSEEYDEMTRFMGGYMWAGSFKDILPNSQTNMISRSRFIMPTIGVFNIISRTLWQSSDILLSGTVTPGQHVSKIHEQDENREEKIWVWVLLGLLSNTYNYNGPNQIIYTFHSVPVVFSNYVLLQYVHISLENFLVGLCNLTSLYEKVNMEVLGIDRQEFNRFINEIETYNKDIIAACRQILGNVDLALNFKEYCQENRESKEGSAGDESEKAKAAVDRFFRNFEKFIGKYGGNDKSHLFHLLILPYSKDGSKKEVDISQLYGILFQEYMQGADNWLVDTASQKKKESMQAFISKLRERSDTPSIHLYMVARYLRDKSARNVKRNLDSLADNIQRYYSKNMEEKLEDSDIEMLYAFYSKILDLYMDDPKTNISDALHEEYKQVVGHFKKVNEYR